MLKRDYKKLDLKLIRNHWWKIRYESVKVIVSAIRKVGFLINKDAIKIDRKNNQVNIVAQKPSGAKAEFKV